MLNLFSDLRPFLCPICNQAFRRRDNFERHMKNTHPDSRLPPTILQPPEPPVKTAAPILDTADLSVAPAAPDSFYDLPIVQQPVMRTCHDLSTIEASQTQLGTVKTRIIYEKSLEDLSDSVTKALVHRPSLALKTYTDLPVESMSSCSRVCEEPYPALSAQTLSSSNTAAYYASDFGTVLPTENMSSPQLVREPIISPPSSSGLAYQAVPVINRSNVRQPSSFVRDRSNTSSIIQMGQSVAASREPHDGSNCVRTITRLSNAQIAYVPPYVPTIVNPPATKPVATSGRESVVDKISSVEDKEEPPKPRLRYYLSDLHWRKRAMEMLNLRNELKADSLVYDKNLESVNDACEETLVSNEAKRSAPECVEFCNSPRNSNPDDEGTFCSRQVIYKVPNLPGETVVSHQHYLPHNRLRHIYPKSVAYHDPQQPSFAYPKIHRSSAYDNALGVASDQPTSLVTLANVAEQESGETQSQAKHVIVENRSQHVNNLRNTLHHNSPFESSNLTYTNLETVKNFSQHQS